jgi:hypothetical protein
MLRDELIELRLSAGIVDPLGPGVDQNVDPETGEILAGVDEPAQA